MDIETIEFIISTMELAKSGLEKRLYEDYCNLTSKGNSFKEIHDEVFKIDKTIKELRSLKELKRVNGN